MFALLPAVLGLLAQGLPLDLGFYLLFFPLTPDLAPQYGYRPVSPDVLEQAHTAFGLLAACFAGYAVPLMLIYAASVVRPSQFLRQHNRIRICVWVLSCVFLISIQLIAWNFTGVVLRSVGGWQGLSGETPHDSLPDVLDGLIVLGLAAVVPGTLLVLNALLLAWLRSSARHLKPLQAPTLSP